ncbi:MAG: CPBP family intramembrane metalloprotease [Epulopiscium sp.]|mgnify:CR=1 FL=1|nr:CPBP family intramembrane metalloprotease [Candidatus Epulonipiscium sp.]
MKSASHSNIAAMILIFIWIGGSLAAALIFEVLNLVGFSTSLPTKVILPQILFLLLPSLLYILISGLNFKDTLRLHPLNFKSIVLVFGFGIFIQPLMMWISSLGGLFFSNQVNDMLDQMSQIPLAIMILMIGITPAIFEEIPFRGILLSGYQELPIPKAALLSGLFFGLLHMNFQQFLYAFLMGVFFAYLVEITGSIYASVVAHFTINTSQVLLSQVAVWATKQQAAENLALDTIPSFGEKLLALVVMTPIAALFTPLAIFLVYLLAKNHQKSWSSLFKIKNDIPSVTIESMAGENIMIENAPPIKMKTWPIYVSLIAFIIFSVLVEIGTRFAMG